MTQAYAILWTDTQSGASALCETSGRNCYEAHRTASHAWRRASGLNRTARRQGYPAHYAPVPMPAELTPHFAD